MTTQTQTQSKVEAIENEIETVKDAETLGETKFSKLFHKARTSKSRVYSGVSLQVRVRDGEVEVHDEPVKTRQGEHLRGTDAWDSMIHLPVKSFMDTKTGKDQIIYHLRQWMQYESR